MALISLDSKFMKFMERLVDVILLNVLWLVFCLPVVTIGASTVAAFSVTLRMIDDEEGSILRDFLKAFRSNFRRATLLWLIHALCLYALFLDVQILSVTAEPSVVVLVVSIVSAAFVVLAFLYAYPLVAGHETTVKACLQNSLRISFQYYGRTGLLIVLLGFEAALFAWNTTMFLFGLIVGPTIILYTISGIAKRIFQDIRRRNPL